MHDPFFFGYGSLVNRRTHVYARAERARIHGWRRAWRHVIGRNVAFLTAVPCEATEIEGLIAQVPGADWQVLDARERSYDRVPAKRVRHAVGDALDIQIYWAPEDKHRPATDAHPILLSYLDVVVQGYLAEFGEAGVRRFFETTDGWDAPVLDDRETPRYPRTQQTTPSERALTDERLAGLGVVPVRAAGAGR